jgi:hypothetical protein
MIGVVAGAVIPIVQPRVKGSGCFTDVVSPPVETVCTMFAR